MAYQIMIIDDDKKFLGQLNELLQAPDYSIRAYDEGLHALNEIKRSRPDLIILDIKEEELMGAQLMALANSSPQVKDIPMILIAGNVNQEELRDAMKNCDIKRHFERPVNPQELVAEVRSVLTASGNIGGKPL